MNKRNMISVVVRDLRDATVSTFSRPDTQVMYDAMWASVPMDADTQDVAGIETYLRAANGLQTMRLEGPAPAYIAPTPKPTPTPAPTPKPTTPAQARVDGTAARLQARQAHVAATQGRTPADVAAPYTLAADRIHAAQAERQPDTQLAAATLGSAFDARNLRTLTPANLRTLHASLTEKLAAVDAALAYRVSDNGRANASHRKAKNAAANAPITPATAPVATRPATQVANAAAKIAGSDAWVRHMAATGMDAATGNAVSMEDFAAAKELVAVL